VLRCSVKDCNNLRIARVMTADNLGPPGVRCQRHGGGRKKRQPKEGLGRPNPTS